MATSKDRTPRRSLGRPTTPEPISDAEALRLVKLHQRLTDERRECYRLADAKTKAIDAMEAELSIYVDARAKAARSKVRTATLKKFVLRIVQKTKNLYYKAELIKEIGEAEFNRRVAELGTADKLEIDVLP